MQFVCRRWSKNQPLVCATSPCALWKWLSNDSHPISCLSSGTKLSRRRNSAQNSPGSRFCTIHRGLHFRRRIPSIFAYFAPELFSFILWVILFPDSRESRREICRWGGFHISETNLGQKLRSCSTWHAALTLKKSDPKCRNSRVQPLTISLGGYFV